VQSVKTASSLRLALRHATAWLQTHSLVQHLQTVWHLTAQTNIIASSELIISSH